MAEVSKEMVGLPLGLLIAQPIIEVAKGQGELCKVYLDTLFKIAFDEKGETKTIKFRLNRPVVGSNGETKLQSCDVEAPLLSLVPVPAFVMDEATVNFSMEVKNQDVEKEDTTSQTGTDISFSAWGFKAQISGKVTTDREHTRSTDKSAKYEIFARAVQQQPAEGMAKLTSIFASVIEPITAQSGGGGGQ